MKDDINDKSFEGSNLSILNSDHEENHDFDIQDTDELSGVSTHNILTFVS